MKEPTAIKETALKWLIKKIQGHEFSTTHGLVKISIPEIWATVALEEEEQQIVDAWENGYENGKENGTTNLGENYYADNYGFLR